MLGSIFREQAIQHRAQPEPIDGLARVTSPHEWMVLLGLTAVLASIVAWGLTGRVERGLVADSVLVRPEPRYAVVAPAAGVVAEALVDVGDRVAAGQPLARIGREELVSPHTGEVSAFRLAPGRAVAAGEEVARIRLGAAAGMAAVAFISAQRALDVEAGMPASLRCPRDAGVRRAEVREVSPRPVRPAPWISEFGLSAPPASHRVRLALAEPTAAAVEGTRCRLRIVLGEDSPIGLLVRGTPDP